MLLDRTLRSMSTPASATCLATTFRWARWSIFL